MKILYDAYKVFENDFMMNSILTLEFKVKFAFITTYPIDHEDQRSRRNHASEHNRSYQTLSSRIVRRTIFDRRASVQTQYAIEFCFLMESNDLFALIDCWTKRVLLSIGGNMTSCEVFLFANVIQTYVQLFIKRFAHSSILISKLYGSGQKIKPKWKK